MRFIFTLAIIALLTIVGTCRSTDAAIVTADLVGLVFQGGLPVSCGPNYDEVETILRGTGSVTFDNSDYHVLSASFTETSHSACTAYDFPNIFSTYPSSVLEKAVMTSNFLGFFALDTGFVGPLPGACFGDEVVKALCILGDFTGRSVSSPLGGALKEAGDIVPLIRGSVRFRIDEPSSLAGLAAALLGILLVTLSRSSKRRAQRRSAFRL